MADATTTLLDEAKLALRVTSGDFDLEVTALIDAAKRDMVRQGVREDLLAEGAIDPLAKMAVMLFCKARFGFDNDDAERFESAYVKTLKDLANAPTLYSDASDEGETA